MDAPTPTTDIPRLCIPFSPQESPIANYYSSAHTENFVTSTLALSQPLATSAIIGNVGNTARLAMVDSVDTSQVFYVNLTPENAGPYRHKLIDLQNQVADFRSYATASTARMLANYPFIQLGNMGRVALGNLKANAISYFFTVQNEALNSSRPQFPRQTLNVQDPGFHTNILHTAMMGLSVVGSLTDPAIELLDKVVVGIVDDLKRSSEGDTTTARQYFILLTVYKLDKSSGTISCEMRTVNFLSTPVTHEVSHGKGSKTMYVTVEAQFSVQDYYFNEQGWLRIRGNFEDMIKQGRALMGDDPTLDVPVD